MATEDEAARREAFLLGLRELTLRCGVVIGGCGCCYSPFLETIDGPPDGRSGYALIDGGQVVWVSPADKSGWMNHSRLIVRPPAGQGEASTTDEG